MAGRGSITGEDFRSGVAGRGLLVGAIGVLVAATSGCCWTKRIMGLERFPVQVQFSSDVSKESRWIDIVWLYDQTARSEFERIENPEEYFLGGKRDEMKTRLFPRVRFHRSDCFALPPGESSEPGLAPGRYEYTKEAWTRVPGRPVEGYVLVLPAEAWRQKIYPEIPVTLPSGAQGLKSTKCSGIRVVIEKEGFKVEPFRRFPRVMTLPR